MLQCYCDYGHDTIVNYETNCFIHVHGIDRINMIFMDVKNSINYSGLAPIQKASETLVMGRGNNADKCILFYTLVKNEGFDCGIYKVNVIDNSNTFISRAGKPVSWFYVGVDFFGMKINFDPSFDKSFMWAAGITNKGMNKGYDLTGYKFNGGQKLFTLTGKPEKVTDDEVFNALDRNFNLKLA
jgi:hypothetical protein